VEVEAVLHLGRVGVAQLLVERLLRHEGVVGIDVKRDVMRGAGTEGPAPLRPVRLVQQLDGAIRAAVGNLEPVIRALDADLAEPERVHEERLLLVDVAHRHGGAEEATNRHRPYLGVVHGLRVSRGSPRPRVRRPAGWVTLIERAPKRSWMPV
jgi:hypothetical protein